MLILLIPKMVELEKLTNFVNHLLKNLMKKINVIILALIASIGAMAQGTVVVNITAANDSKDVLNLIEVSTFSPNYVQGEDAAPKLMPAGDNVYIYSVLDTKNCSQIGTNNLIGTWITLKTNSATSYTFSFTGKTGKTFGLIDHVLNTTTPMVEGVKYAFTAEANITISNRFEVGEYVPGDFKVCTTFDHVELYDNTGTDNIVITDMAKDTIVNVAPVAVYQSIDLSGKSPGHYILTVNGKTYEFCNKPVNVSE